MDLRINPPLGTEESQYFLLGLEAGLFLIDKEGYVQSELLPRPSTGNGEQKMCPIFWHNPSPHLFREGICQLATASSLILKRGWQKRQIVMEPSIKEHRSFAGGVDILVKSPTGRILVCAEVKRSIAELQKLVADFQACCKRGPHASTDCAFEQNHPSYEFCASYQPIYFWAVAPEADVCFKMTYNEKLHRGRGAGFTSAAQCHRINRLPRSPWRRKLTRFASDARTPHDFIQSKAAS